MNNAYSYLSKKKKQPKHCYVQRTHMKIKQLFSEVQKAPVGLNLLQYGSRIFALLLWSHPRQDCAFYSPDLFMTGRGVSYYGAYVCTAYCLPGIRARGCHSRDYSTAAPRC